MTDVVVSKLDKARLLLFQAKNASDAKRVMDMAHAAEIYAKRQKMSDEAIGHAHSIKIEATRLLGDFLRTQPKNGGLLKRGSVVPNRNHGGIATLADVGITKKESSNAQLVSKVAERCPDVYQQLLSGDTAINGLKEHLPKSQEPKNDLFEECEFVSDFSDLSGRKFKCIYADPPWRYSNQGTRGSTNNHYATMTVDEICALPVGELCEDNCHLHLWTTNGFIFDSPRIFEAWGFVFKSSFVWVKPQIGMGNYWRNSHEFLLLGVRGSMTAEAMNLKSWVESPRTSHSQKPDVVRAMVEKLSPGPRLELFGRKPVPNWTVFGNEVLV